MQDRVSLYPGRVKLTPVAGQANTYDLTRADQPTQEGDPLNKNTLLKDSTAALFGLDSDAVPDSILAKIGRTPLSWVLIQQYETAGSYTFKVPAGVHEIGVYMIGGGGAGGAIVTTNNKAFYANGGASGYGKNLVLDVSPGQEIPVVVGSGGAGVYGGSTSGVSGNDGGTTAVNGVTVAGGKGGLAANSAPNGSCGGQGSNKSGTNSNATMNTGVPRYASYPTNQDIFGKLTYTAQLPTESQNRFDPTMVTLSAGGAAYMYGDTLSTGYVETMPDLPDGTSGGDGMVTSEARSGNPASGYGNGGGGIVSSNYPTSGAGSDGVVFIYAKGVWK